MAGTPAATPIFASSCSSEASGRPSNALITPMSPSAGQSTCQAEIPERSRGCGEMRTKKKPRGYYALGGSLPTCTLPLLKPTRDTFGAACDCIFDQAFRRPYREKCGGYYGVEAIRGKQK